MWGDGSCSTARWALHLRGAGADIIDKNYESKISESDSRTKISESDSRTRSHTIDDNITLKI
jgi:hypothetical protein